MAYNTKSIILDQDTKPIAQLYDPTADAYVPLEGTELNGMRMHITGSKVEDVALITNATSISTGAAKPVGMFKVLRFEVWGSGTFTVQIKVNESNGSGNYYSVQPTNLGSMTVATNITLAGVYEVDVSGFSNVQVSVTAISGGNVNASGKWVA